MVPITASIRTKRLTCGTLPRALVLFVSVASGVGVALAPRDACAQRVYVYGPPPPPPYAYRHRVRYYEVEEPWREPAAMFTIAADLEGALPVNIPRSLDGNQVTGGGGLKLRMGEELRFRGGVRLTPEVGYGYDHLWASDDLGNAYDWSMHRLFGGARLGFGRVVVPSFYAHAGYGWRVTGDPAVPQQDGFAWDVGTALDFRVVPHLTFGLHLEYAAIEATRDTPQWLALGGHMGLWF